MTKCTLLPSQIISFIEGVLSNHISVADVAELRQCITAEHLAVIIQKIYDLNEFQVLDIAALGKIMKWVDELKNSQRNSKFLKKIKKDFRSNDQNKIILAEGDSWFNYPVILSDVIDWIGMEDNMAIYSLASGGDWLLNMLEGRKYVEELSILHPDVFLISGGGNDLVGDSRFAAIVDPSGNSQEFMKSEFAQMLMDKVAKASIIPVDKTKFDNGVRYLSKDFFALMLFFHLQYYYLINGILCGGTGDPVNSKFPGIKIITQGYDYALPSSKLGFGLNPLKAYKPFIRMFLGHSSWLKTPLQLRGITNPAIQENIVYAMIYLFNEMMIHTGDLFCQIPGLKASVFHIDSRGSVDKNGWTDELHPLPIHFRNTAQAFIDCINNKQSPHGQVFVVNKNNPI